MDTLGKFVSSISDVIEFNKATLSGCVDVIVVRQPDGSLKSTPFHIRFGKLKLLKCKNSSVTISVNASQSTLKMKLGKAGEGFFEEESILSTSTNFTDHQLNILNQRQNSLPNRFSKEATTDDKVLIINESSSKISKMKSSLSISRKNTRAESQTSNMNEYYEEDLVKTNDRNYQAGELIFLDEEICYPIECSPEPKVQQSKVKTLRPSSAQLESLNLKMGINTITYTVKSSLQGVQEVAGHIYLWSSDADIIISDIDGTITKTDVMGHLMSMVGKDWSQPGIAPLYTNIRRNGYHILYLTARAIGQSKQTKEFVNSVYQDGKMLPYGPLITSPDRMLPSVKREILFKRPEIFKMAVLKDIRSLFPSDRNPFHAGFGNRETDAIAYKSVGIPLEKVFIVNPKGHIHHHGNETPKSYAVINSMIKDIFPGIIKTSKDKLIEDLNKENCLDLTDMRLMQSNLVRVIS